MSKVIEYADDVSYDTFVNFFDSNTVDKIAFLKSYYSILFMIEDVPIHSRIIKTQKLQDVIYQHAINVLYSTLLKFSKSDCFEIQSKKNYSPFAICVTNKKYAFNRVAKHIWVGSHSMLEMYLNMIRSCNCSKQEIVSISSERKILNNIFKIYGNISLIDAISVSVNFLYDLIMYTGIDNDYYYLFTNDKNIIKGDPKLRFNYDKLKVLIEDEMKSPIKSKKYNNRTNQNNNYKFKNDDDYFEVSFVDPIFDLDSIITRHGKPLELNKKTYNNSSKPCQLPVIKNEIENMPYLLSEKYNGKTYKTYILEWCAKYHLIGLEKNLSYFANVWWQYEGSYLKNKNSLNKRLSCHDLFIMWCMDNDHPTLIEGTPKYKRLYKKWWKKFRERVSNES